MRYCTSCGVELDDSFTSCPLCGFNPEGEIKDANEKKNDEFLPSDILLLYKKESRKYIWEISAIITFSAIAVCSIVDFTAKRSLTWSLYADICIMASWIILTMALLAFRKYLIIFPGSIITILVSLYLIDLVSPPVDWFFGLGLPLTFAIFLPVLILAILWKYGHMRGFNFLAFALIFVAMFTIACESIIDLFMRHHVTIKWSAIVTVSILPPALMLLFVHYRMNRGKRLDSYFHV